MPVQDSNLDLLITGKEGQRVINKINLMEHRNWLCPSKKINIYRSMSLEANYALKRIHQWYDLDMKKPTQQQTVKLLELAVELCSSFYKAEQNKRQTKTERTGKIKDLTTNKNKVHKMKNNEMIVKPHHKLQSIAKRLVARTDSKTR
uniref:Uncharacterized protein n=1 Tax=Timema cristinae TaxID=61476 RepID=A0A7R9D4J8_TIMCR|nr:unnamed protein product [Timema cristinae]